MVDKKDIKKVDCKVESDGKVKCMGEYTGVKGEPLECEIDYADGKAITVSGDEGCIERLHPTVKKMLGKDKVETED
jgi:hypothetical protein